MRETEQVYLELAALRRGHGLNAPQVADRVGPNLRRICGIGPELTAPQARVRLLGQLNVTIADLPAYPALAVQAALGLPPASQSRFLRERMEWLGRRIERDPRTATRRVDDGLRLLAERLVSRPPEDHCAPRVFTSDSWLADQLRSTLSLQLDPPPSPGGDRRIPASRDGHANGLESGTGHGLGRITVSWNIPKPGFPVDEVEVRVEVRYGEEVVHEEAVVAPSYLVGLDPPAASATARGAA